MLLLETVSDCGKKKKPTYFKRLETTLLDHVPGVTIFPVIKLAKVDSDTH